ncbi:hypothetical protein HanPSC8_Chr08g0328771 [Helianthus annuus]|nr:hypothetical protein HanPSC8_Chr08g0328771 [Helianthus annuus]
MPLNFPLYHYRTPYSATILSSLATTRRHTAARRSHFSLHTQPLLSLRQSLQMEFLYDS